MYTKPSFLDTSAAHVYPAVRLYANDVSPSIIFPYLQSLARNARYGAISFFAGAILFLGGSARTRLAMLATLALLQTGCATIPPAPKVLSVSTPTYVPIPPELSANCRIAQKTDADVLAEAQKLLDALPPAVRAKLGPLSPDSELVLLVVARFRKFSLDQCNSDKAAIRGLSGSPVPVK